MSLRIKLPAKSTRDDEPQLSGTMPSSTNRRKLTKRGRLTVQSDDENSDHLENSANILPRNDDSSRSHMAEHPDGDNEADDDSRFLDPRLASFSATTTIASASARHRRSKGIASDAPPAAKKKQVMKENDSEDEYAEQEEEEAHTTSEDENYIHEAKRPAKGKGRQKQKLPKGKSSLDVLDSSTKGERKPRMKGEAAVAAAAAGTKRSRTIKSSTKSEDSNVVDVVGDASNALATSPQPQPPQKEPSSPPVKKRKLPTIKKNKPATSAGPSTPSQPATTASKSTVSAKPGVSDVFTPTTPTVRMTPAMAGNTDFDLRNASVYAELFGASAGNAPRSGLSRREKDEERRRELDKMRDEARAKRLTEKTQPFDLQAQYEKISRFEEKLRQSRSSAMYPNFLAGKWRELWDRQQRRESDKERQPNRNWMESMKEDGEMNED